MKYSRKVFYATLAVNGLIALAELVTARAHRGGHANDLLGYVDGAGQILELPGFTVADFFGLRPNHRWTWRGFYCGLGINLIFYLVVFGAWARWAIRFRPPTDGKGLSGYQRPRRLRLRIMSSPKGLRIGSKRSGGSCSGASTGSAASEDNSFVVESEPLFSRRRMLVNGGRAAAAAGAGAAAWGFFAEARWFDITHRRVTVRGLPASLSNLRIVQLSDIHHGAWTSERWLRQIVDTANELAPDLVALTGDYVYRGLEYAEPVAREMAQIRARIGTVAVMGNHDWWEDGRVCQRAFANVDIPLIDNARLFITPDRNLVTRATEGLCVAGVGDLWEQGCDYERALGGVGGGIPRLLLSHNPDVAEEPAFLRGGYRVDLMLSGHTHGGQIRLPGLGAPVTNSRYGQKYAQGLVRGPVCPVYVSRGLGTTVMPVRFGVRPEIALIELAAG